MPPLCLGPTNILFDLLLIALSVFVAAARTNLLDSMLSSFSLSEAILNVLRIEGIN
jgi:hypothetical protein